MDHILQFEMCISSVKLKVSTCTSTVPRFHCHDRLWEYDSLKIGNPEDLTRIKLGGLALAVNCIWQIWLIYSRNRHGNIQTRLEQFQVSIWN